MNWPTVTHDFANDFWRELFSYEAIGIVNELFESWFSPIKFAETFIYSRETESKPSPGVRAHLINLAQDISELEIDMTIRRSEIATGEFLFHMHPFAEKDVRARLPTEHRCGLFSYFARCLMFGAFLSSGKTLRGTQVEFGIFKYNAELKEWGPGPLLLFLRCLISAADLFSVGVLDPQFARLAIDVKECIYDILELHNLLFIFNFVEKTKFIQEITAQKYIDRMTEMTGANPIQRPKSPVELVKSWETIKYQDEKHPSKLAPLQPVQNNANASQTQRRPRQSLSTKFQQQQQHQQEEEEEFIMDQGSIFA